MMHMSGKFMAKLNTLWFSHQNFHEIGINEFRENYVNLMHRSLGVPIRLLHRTGFISPLEFLSCFVRQLATLLSNG